MFIESKAINKKVFLGLLFIPLLCAILLSMFAMLRGDNYKVDYTLIVGSRYNTIVTVIQKESLFVQLAQETNISYIDLKNSFYYALDQRNQSLSIIVSHKSKLVAERIAMAIHKTLTNPILISRDSVEKKEIVLQKKKSYQMLLGKLSVASDINPNALSQVKKIAEIGAATNSFVIFNHQNYMDDLYVTSKIFFNGTQNININNMEDKVNHSILEILDNIAKTENLAVETVYRYYYFYYYDLMIKYADNRLMQLDNLQKIQAYLMLGSLSAYQQRVSLLKIFTLTYIFVFSVCVFGVFARRVIQSSKEG